MSKGQGRVFRQPGSANWFLDYTIRGRRRREATHTSVHADAVEMLRQRIGARKEGTLVGTPDKVRFTDLRAALLRRYEQKGNRSKPRAEQALDQLEAFFKSDTRALDISQQWVGEYIAERRRVRRARSTIAYEVACLNSAFSAAVKEGLLGLRPAFTLPTVQNVRECWFTVPELDRLLELLPTHLRAPVEYAALVGWRRKNVFSLTWDNVSFADGTARAPIGTTKNGEPFLATFKIGSRLNALLREQQRASDGSALVFPDDSGLRDAWERAVGPDGLDKWGTQYDPDTNTLRKVRPRFHDLRHTFAQHAVDSGADARTIQECGGWKTPDMLDRYHVKTTKQKRAAAAQHDAYVKAERKRAKRDASRVLELRGRRTA